jgi:hypothetical protein
LGRSRIATRADGELALRLKEFEDTPRIAAVRDHLRGDRSPGRWEHTLIQLEVAALGRKIGATVTLEGAACPGEQRPPEVWPYDVRLLTDDLVIPIEAFGVLTSKRWLDGTKRSEKIVAPSMPSERCTERQLRAVLDELYPNGTSDAVSGRTRRSRQQTKDRIAELFLRGETQGNAPGSKWAAVNAIVEYGDWLRPLRSSGQRFARALDDGPEKTRALQLVAAA